MRCLSIDFTEKKRIFFICGDMKTSRKMSVVSLMNDLAEKGENITAITDARCNITDFRYDHRIIRLSFDMGVDGCYERSEKLAHFLSSDSGGIAVHTDTARSEFLSDAEIIKKVCGKLICFETDGYIKSFHDSPHSFSGYYSALKDADAVVSGSFADYLVNSKNGVANHVFIKYRFPFLAGEFRPCGGGKKILLVVLDKGKALDKALKALLKITENDADILVRIISGDEFQPLENEVKNKCTRLLPRACFSGDDKTINDEADGCDFALIADRFITPSYPYLMLISRLVPVCFSSEYVDGAFNFFGGGELCKKCFELLEPKTRNRASAEISELLSPEKKDAVVSDWLLLFAAVAAGKPLPKLDTPKFDAEQSSDILLLNSEIRSAAKPEFAKERKISPLKHSILKKISLRELKRYEQYSCIQLSPEDVRRSQLLALKMFGELERICKKYGITYYVAAGSLLGAVRHGGQIPWDDDVDVTMPRHDYERFIKIAQSELPNDMILPLNNYPYGFHRIQIKGTSIKRALRQKGPHGIFLDILPLDGAAPTDKLKKRHAQINERMIFIMYESVKPQPVLNKKNLSVWVKRLILKNLVPKKILQLIWYNNAVKYDVDKSSEWVCLPGYYGYDKECFDKSCWGEPFMMMYEGRRCPVMSRWENYLKLHYGDYMQPPPLLFRRTHFFYDVDFGKYKNMKIEEIEREVYNA